MGLFMHMGMSILIFGGTKGSFLRTILANKIYADR